MRKRIGLAAAGLFLAAAAVAYGATVGFRSATPTEFDPAHTQLVQSAWLEGIGCPTAATRKSPAAASPMRFLMRYPPSVELTGV